MRLPGSSTSSYVGNGVFVTPTSGTPLLAASGRVPFYDPPLTHEEKVAELLELWKQVDPDPADVFEDLLAAELGVVRHPAMPYEEWREVRYASIDEDDPRTDEAAGRVEAYPDRIEF